MCCVVCRTSIYRFVSWNKDQDWVCKYPCHMESMRQRDQNDSTGRRIKDAERVQDGFQGMDKGREMTVDVERTNKLVN